MTIRVPLDPEHGPLLSPEAMSLLLGVTADKIRALPGTDIMMLPAEWMKSGRRRAKEARAHGHDDMVGAMTYWAEKDHGASLVIEYVPAGGVA